MLGHILKGGTPGSGVTEKRVTATEQAVATPGGGRDRPRTTTASRHRRAASRSEGATSAERDGRPVLGSRQCPTQPPSVPVAGIRDRRPVTVTASGLGTAAVAVSATATAAAAATATVPEADDHSSEHVSSRTGGRAVLENVPPTLRACLGTFSRGGSLGNGVTEKCVTATEQAVETPEGGRDRPRTTTASRHRRAASRSGGAMSAERDGRPVLGNAVSAPHNLGPLP
jgi:plasmid stabilization system protein ParE